MERCLDSNPATDQPSWVIVNLSSVSPGECRDDFAIKALEDIFSILVLERVVDEARHPSVVTVLDQHYWLISEQKSNNNSTFVRF